MNPSFSRYTSPTVLVRHRGARLLQGFSPRMARSMQFTSAMGFKYWINLESDPAVRYFCERPMRTSINGLKLAPDFWVRTNQDEVFVLLMPGDRDHSLPAIIDGFELRQIPAPEHAAHLIWVQNWQRMLSVINTIRLLLPEDLLKAIDHSMTRPVAISRVERDFSGNDVPIIRGAIFELLRTGKLQV